MIVEHQILVQVWSSVMITKQFNPSKKKPKNKPTCRCRAIQDCRKSQLRSRTRFDLDSIRVQIKITTSDQNSLRLQDIKLWLDCEIWRFVSTKRLPLLLNSKNVVIIQSERSPWIGETKSNTSSTGKLSNQKSEPVENKNSVLALTRARKLMLNWKVALMPSE